MLQPRNSCLSSIEFQSNYLHSADSNNLKVEKMEIRFIAISSFADDDKLGKTIGIKTSE